MSKRSFYESCDMLRPWLHRKSAYAFGVGFACSCDLSWTAAYKITKDRDKSK